MNILIIVSSSPATGSYYLSPINWFLKLYHQTQSHSKNNYKWMSPVSLYNEIDNYKKISKIVEDQKVSVVGFSMYVWNRDIILDICCKLKKNYPNLTIILGGPDVDAHVNKNFFTNHFYIDYAIYGDGEEAFSLLLDHIAGFKVNLVNCVDKNGTVYTHKVFTDKKILEKSPYLEYTKEIIEFFQTVNSDLCQINNSSNEYEKILLVWETTKGCPYACSFCDWSSGLHNKVRIWGDNDQSPNWKKEIDLFFEIKKQFNIQKMYIYWTNPNVGLSKQDTDIVDYWCKLKKQWSDGPMIYNPQLSKLKKHVAFRLLEKMIEHDVTEFFKFDLQDINPVVLENINRPEIPWPEHKKMIIDIKSKFKDKKIVFNRYSNRLTFIWGLPGQTLENLKINMSEAGSLNSFALHLPFEILPNTPAANTEYIKKYNLQIDSIVIVGHGNSFGGVIVPDRVIHRAVIGSYSMNTKEWFTGLFIFYIYNSMFNFYELYGKEDKIFQNYNKVEHIINDSYQHFCSTKRVEIAYSNKFYSIYEYVKDNKAVLYDLLYS